MISINGQKLETTYFPDGTTQVWKLSESILNKSCAWVAWKFSSETEFLQLAQLKTLLDSRNIKTSLTLTYLPYGRQDKEVSNNSTFALHTFAKLLNSLEFSDVFCNDPHSEVASKLINNFYPVYPIDEVCRVAKLVESNTLCYPDKGAVSKYTKVFDFSYIYGEKVRDQSTGNILNYKLVGDPAGKNILIVDDICDGGMTFILLTKDLLVAGAKSVTLFVTHGIFSKGVKVLLNAGIQRIFTQDGEMTYVGPKYA